MENDGSRVYQNLVTDKRFIIFCTTCMRTIVAADTNPFENNVSARVAITSSKGHKKAFRQEHQLEFIDTINKTSKKMI